MLKDHTPYPKSPETTSDKGPPARPVIGAITSKVTPKGPTPQEKCGKNDTFGASGVWGKSRRNCERLHRHRPDAEAALANAVCKFHAARASS
jgi:hypothetical protein